MCHKAPHKTWICTSCIGEPFLSAHIKSAGPRKICHFCSRKRPCFSLEKISDLTETTIEQHFIRTPVDPSPMEFAMIKYGRHGWYRAGDEIECVIENLLHGIFNGLETMQVGREPTVIVKAGPGTAISSLYRARWNNSHDMLEKILVLPDRELGPPPHRSSGSNRMSARGGRFLWRKLS